MKKNKKERTKSEVIGTVISDKMSKTIVVEVGRMAVHPVFKKITRRFVKIKAHDEKNLAKTGDRVKLRKTRPISRDKRWRLAHVVGKTV